MTAITITAIFVLFPVFSDMRFYSFFLLFVRFVVKFAYFNTARISRIFPSSNGKIRLRIGVVPAFCATGLPETVLRVVFGVF